MKPVLLIDFGSTYTKITAVDVVSETVLGTARGITTVTTDITEGLQEALERLFTQTGKLEFEKVLGCSSAAGGLKMVAVGLVPELTAEAAKRAALGAGAKVLGVFCHELSEYELQDIAALAPDIILLAGGTDGGNKTVIAHNACMLTQLGLDVPVIVAGNKSITPTVVRTLNEVMSEVVYTENVMPRLNELNIEPARETIRGVFLKKIVEAKGLNKANKLVDRLVMPTPAAVLRAAELLGRGTDREAGLGDIVVVDIGGATTDLYSIAKGDPTQSSVNLRGLPEPFAKRTVEGDLGMRYSASALMKAAGAVRIAQWAGVGEQEVIDYISTVEASVDYLPQSPQEQQVEIAMARACTALGMDRHTGYLETYFTPFGSAFCQTGKDLTQVRTVIGTGGVLINNPEPEEILAGVLFDQANPHILKPHKPQYCIDRSYIMAAMGLLGEEYPEIAIRMMKKYIVGGN